MPGAPKASCVNCHFFQQNTLEGSRHFVREVSHGDRDLTKKGDLSWKERTSEHVCVREVWAEGFKMPESGWHTHLVEVDRKEKCFFWEYTPGMLNRGAEELQKRAAETKEATRDRRLTIGGLWIAAMALVVSVIFQIVSLFVGD